jgi:hypothetical protein
VLTFLQDKGGRRRCGGRDEGWTTRIQDQASGRTCIEDNHLMCMAGIGEGGIYKENWGMSAGPGESICKMPAVRPMCGCDTIRMLSFFEDLRSNRRSPRSIPWAKEGGEQTCWI